MAAGLFRYAFFFGVALAAEAHAEAVPADVQALLLFKTLSYDRNLATRAEAGLTIDVAYQKGDAASEAAARAFAAAADALAAKVTVSGRPVTSRLVAITDGGAPIDPTAAAVYLAPGLDAELSAILTYTAAEDVLSVTGTSAMSAAGVSLAFEVQNAKPRLVINLPTSTEEGADLSSTLLALAEVHR